MKKYIFLSLILSLFVVGVASASTSSSYTINNVLSDEWNNSEFDRVALDVVVPSNEGKTDYIQSLAIMNLETATDGKGISDLYLWKDEGAVGFQGMGIDKRVGRGKWNSESGTWYWTDLGLTVPSTGLRIFVTVETERTINSRYTVKLVIPKIDDINKNGTFDVGDKGIFMASGNNGPTDKEISNIDSQLIKTSSSDGNAPKAAITNLPENYQVNLNEAYLISGLARDEGFSGMMGVSINIAKTGESGSWSVVSTDSTTYGRWTYSWTPSTTGTYTIKLKATDFSGNESISSPITVEVIDGDKISQTESTFTVDNLTAKADGKIYINTEVVVKDANGDPLSNKAVEVSYLRNNDGFIARDMRITDDNGTLVWGIPTITSGSVILSAIIDGKAITQTYTLSFTD
ncbi:MAG: invasin domain 3-containing protein [Minisyncoccales bacterium]